MAIDLLKDRGTPLEKQRFTWRELASPPYRKLNDDDLRANGTQFVDKSELPPTSPSHAYRDQLNADGSPSEKVAAGYVWTPGTELSITNADGFRPRTNGNGRTK